MKCCSMLINMNVGQLLQHKFRNNRAFLMIMSLKLIHNFKISTFFHICIYAYASLFFVYNGRVR